MNAESIKEERVLQSYKFTVPAWQENAESTNYYRGDNDANWQVSLETSTEGVGTYMTYWIEAPNNSNLTKGHDVKQGEEIRDFNDLRYTGDVHLATENNNNSDKVNTTTGKWDEE